MRPGHSGRGAGTPGGEQLIPSNSDLKIGNGLMRASDQDRDEAVAELRRAFSEGRLDLAELDDRASRAYTARTWADLRAVTADLPAVSGRAGRLSSFKNGAPIARSCRPPLPFAPMVTMSVVWLTVAAVAPIPVLAVAAGALALFALWTVCWKSRHPSMNRPPRDSHRDSSTWIDQY